MKKVLLIVVLAIALLVVACAAPTVAPTVAPTKAPAASSSSVASSVAPSSSSAAPTKAPEPTKAPAPAGVKVLRLGRATYPDIIDPQKSSFGIEIEVMKLCYEGLTAIDNKGNIGPGSADKWTVAPDGKSMVFHIRDGLKRADGTAMNASDFEYALKRAVDPSVLGKQYPDILSDIKGASALVAAEGKKPSAADLQKMYDAYGVKADDAKRELTVSFDQPAPYWHYVAYIWETYVPDKKKVDAAPDSWWNKATGHSCYGPYTIKSIEEGKRIVYEANAGYWRGKPKIDRIEMTYITDVAQRFEAYKKDEFDEIDVDAAVLQQTLADAKLKSEMVRYATAVTRAFAFNSTKKPMDDKAVRTAFSQMIDREAWVRDVFKGIGVPTTRWIPPGVPGAQPTKPGVPNTDVKASVATLVKAGYGKADGTVDCAKLGEIKLTFASTAANRPRYEWLAAQIQKAWGCSAVLDPVDSTVATALVKDVKTHPQINYSGWIQDYPHPQNWLSVYWKCTAGFAIRVGYCNKANDELMAKADSTVNFDEAVKMYSQVEDTIIADIPYAFVIHQEGVYLIKPWLMGLKENPSSSDAEWAGEWGPVWTYDVDLTKVPASYPKQ